MNTLPCPICHRETTCLYHVKGKPGEYCQQCCPPKTAPTFDWTVEDVSGIVIGDITTHYEFWNVDNTNRIDVIDAESADEAIRWFQCHYPDAYAIGARMRVFE